MSDWTAGYVSDIEYMPGFYAEQAPAHLDAVCLVRGLEPPVAPGAPYAWCELGCGVGETAMVLAAANPQAEFWAFDFNPAHIARGRGLAAGAGLDNLHLEEASFGELVGAEPSGRPLPALPQFDYIVLHGVWSWVSAENRAHLVHFMDARLKPGGLVYVTYNALPGWTATQPLQHLLSRMAAHMPGRSDRRIVEALHIAEAMVEAGALPLDKEMLERLAQERDKGHTAYLSHEYLNAHWAPCYHSDVAGALAEAKLSFAASANMLENFPDLQMTPEQRGLLDRLPEAERETLKDYFLPRTFRRDIFIRGPRPIPDRRRDARLSAQRLALAVPPAAVSRTVKVPIGEATLNERFYGPAFAALAAGIRSVGALLADPAAAGSTATPPEVIGMTVGARQTLPAPNLADPATTARAQAFNTVHLRACADEARANTVLAAPVLGTGIPVRLFEMLTYEALTAGTPAELEPLVAACWTLLERRGDRLRAEGKLVEDREENLALLRDNLPEVLEVAVPYWRRVGAL